MEIFLLRNYIQKLKTKLLDVFITKLDWSGTTAVEKPVSDVLSLYPNPSNGTLVFDYQENSPATMEVIDRMGKTLKLLLIHPGKNEVKLNLPAGVYFVRDTKNGATQKLVIE